MEGEAINFKDDMKIPMLEFQVEDTSVTGRAFCNSIRGSYEMSDEEIKFSAFAGTRMTCPDQVLEDTFLRLFERIKKYKISNSELSLFDSNQSELLRFRKTDQ